MRNRKGFTLMEVLTAIAIIAIVSGPLLYLFVTSTRVGRNSYDSDKANAISVELIERIKADSGNWAENGYIDSPVIADGVMLHNFSKTLYFDSDWSLTGDPALARFQADISLSEGGIGGGVSRSFIPELVAAEGSFAGISYRLETLNKDNSPTNIDHTLIVEYSDPNYTVDGSALIRNTLNNAISYISIPQADCPGGVIPIVVDVEGEPDDLIHFTVDNRTSLEIAFYIYGDTDKDSVTAETINGFISTNYMHVGSETIEYDQLEVNIRFTYKDSGKKITDYTTLIYLPG